MYISGTCTINSLTKIICHKEISRNDEKNKRSWGLINYILVWKEDQLKILPINLILSLFRFFLLKMCTSVMFIHFILIALSVLLGTEDWNQKCMNTFGFCFASGTITSLICITCRTLTGLACNLFQEFIKSINDGKTSFTIIFSGNLPANGTLASWRGAMMVRHLLHQLVPISLAFFFF